jgi:hypothetical protein
VTTAQPQTVDPRPQLSLGMKRLSGIWCWQVWLLATERPSHSGKHEMEMRERRADEQMDDVMILGSKDKLLPQVAREDMQSENSCPALVKRPIQILGPPRGLCDLSYLGEIGCMR